MGLLLRCLVIVFLLAPASGGATEGKTLPVAGWAETVRLYPGGILVNAKLDTGANTSSIHVRDAEYYKRNSADWVRFTFKNLRGVTTLIYRPILRIASIREAQEVIQQRPVISVGICIGDIYGDAEVTLFHRTGYNFALLLGRRFLEGKVLVDPSTKRLLTIKCPLGNPPQ